MDSVPLGLSPPNWTDADRALLGQVLGPFIVGSRWFRAKTHRLQSVQVVDTVPLTDRSALAVAAVETNRETYRYALPLALARSAQPGSHPIAPVDGGQLLCDGLDDPELLGSWLDLVLAGAPRRGDRSTLRPELIAGGPRRGATGLPARRLSAEQSNSTVVYGDRAIMKLFRQLDDGESCELEVGRFLTRAGFPHIAPLSGALSWIPDRDGESARRGATLSVFQEFVPGAITAWDDALNRLSRASADADWLARERRWAAALGQRLGELHLALASDREADAFQPEPLTSGEQERLADRAGALFEQALSSLHGGPIAEAELSWLWDREAEVHARIDELRNVPVGGQVIRVHGDLHLGQILERAGERAGEPDRTLKFIDFEGEPSRSLEDRRGKRCPLADVASMLRSFHYAAFAAQRTSGQKASLVARWTEAVSADFVQAHLAAVRGTQLLPPNAAARTFALRFFVLEKCLYELKYELDNRPDWAEVPLNGLRELLSD